MRRSARFGLRGGWRRGLAVGISPAAIALALVSTAHAAGTVGGRTAAEPPAGTVFHFGAVPALGSVAGLHLKAPEVGIEATPSGRGYWLVAADGGVFSFGDAHFHGSTGAIHLNQPIVGMATTPTAHGYWLVARDGGVFSFGDARFHGSTGAVHLSKPIVGMAATPTGLGYWLVAADGGIFTFGDARFDGSEGGARLSSPIVGMAATPTGHGYWLAAADGRVVGYGDALPHGSASGIHLDAPIVGIAATPTGRGYWLVAADGGIFTFGDARFHGSEGGQHLPFPVVGLAATRSGYWIAEGTPPPPPPPPLPSPFTPALDAYLSGVPGLVTAAVEDLDTGHVFTFNPGLALYTASTVKLEILGTLLSEAEAAGRGLTPYEQSLAIPMIEVSDNNAATTLFNYVGGVGAVQSWDRSIGLTGTFVNSTWWFTTTSAVDELKVMDTYVNPNAVLDGAARDYGLSLLAHVEPIQIFGVDYGIDPSALRAVKTGRLPDEGVYNAVGWIQGDGRDYLIATYTQSVPTEPGADAAMDAVSLSAWTTLRH